MTDQGRRDLTSLIRNEHGGWALVMLFVIIPHFSALVAGYVRWGAVPMAIGMAFGVYFAIIGTMFTFVAGGTPDFALGIWTIVMVVMCLGCHIGVLLRVQSLGAK